MGLLDSILAGQGGGLFGSNYMSQLFDRPEMPQYDAMGNYTGITPQAQSPFPVQPITPGSLAPSAQPSIFNGGVQTPAFNQFAGIPVGPSAPQQAEPPQAPVDAGPSGYMKVGDYNMPQFGPRDLYQPQQAQLPPNATPTQGQMPQQPTDLPPSLGGGGQPNGFIRGLQSIGNGGGLISALTGNYNDPISTQRANLKAQFDALAPILGPQKAMLAVMNPEAGKILIEQALGTKNDFGVISENDGAKTYGFIDKNRQTVQGIPSATPPQAKFDNVSSLRKEVAGLPEVKRYGEALPVFRSMVQSRDNPTAAGDLDFVYGVAKIFDPESVVREGEMKLVGQAQSIPEAVKGAMQRVVYGGERLTPEARQRILEVAQTRMKELESATTNRLSPYPEIAKRNNMRTEDVMPQFQQLPTVSPLGMGANSGSSDRTAVEAEMRRRGFLK